MKKNLKNNNFAIYNFPYYKKNRGFLRMFVAKALLAFITCFYGAYYFSEMLKFEDKAFFSAMMAGSACLVFTVLLGLFGRRIVFVFSVASIVFFIKPVIEYAKDFAYHALKVADGSLISADRILKNADKTSDPLPFLLILSAVFGLLFAFCSHHRFNPELVLTYFAIMVIPSFIKRVYRGNGGSLVQLHGLFRKLFLGGGGSYQRDPYGQAVPGKRSQAVADKPYKVRQHTF